MQERSRLIVLGVVIVVIGLIVVLPARVAYQWFAPPGIAMSGIDGSIWSGRAQHADVAGVYMRDLSWRFRPIAIFKGGLGYSIDASPAPGNITANVNLGVTGTVSLQDVIGTIPLQSLVQAANMPGLQGRLDIQLERLVIDNQLPVAADGEIQVRSLIAPVIHRGPIGDYRVELFTQNSGVMASVEDTNGIVDLAGSLQVKPDRSYSFAGLVAPTARTPGDLRRQLQFLGTANERGQYELRLEGSL